MRVFVTGATGFIGSVIVQELIGAGHQVLGLARSDKSAEVLVSAGAEVHRGALDELDSLRSGAAAAEGVIHCAFIHDFSDFQAAATTDRQAVEALGATLVGSNRPLVIASGILGVKPGELATENDEGDLSSFGSLRLQTEAALLAMSSQGVRSAVVRLPPSVHGKGDHGFVPMLIETARKNGVSAYIGDGLNRWPAVHRLDAAHLFRLALEKGEAGTRYHAIGDGGIPVRDIAEVIGSRLNLPVASKSPEEAVEHFGWLGHVFGLDAPASSALTQQQLGWKATQPGLLSDVEENYF